MTAHSLKNLHKLIIIFIFVIAVAVFVPCAIAIRFGRVTPYMPYLSDCGGNFPEAGIFTSSMVIGAILSQCIIMLRWIVVDNIITKDTHNSYMFWNLTSLMLGSVSSIALILLASFPTTNPSYVHNSACGTASMCVLLYMLCQTWISLKLSRQLKASTFRLVISIFSCISLLTITIFGILGSALWSGDHQVAVKNPEDKGFLFYVISACAEWIYVLLFVLFYATYISEFKDSVFQFRLTSTSLPHKSTQTAAAH